MRKLSEAVFRKIRYLVSGVNNFERKVDMKKIRSLRKWRKCLFLPIMLSIIVCLDLSAAESDDVLRLRYWQAPVTLNPGMAGGLKDLDACRIVYEPLASYDADGNMILFLAAEIPTLDNGGLAEDGKSVTWKLKHNVKWSDGQPFTAHDVRFTYKFYSNPDNRYFLKRFYEGIAQVRIIDDHTIKIIFRKITPVWSAPFVGIAGMIMPKHIFKASDNASTQAAPENLRPVGTGPYRVKEFRKEEMLLIGDDLVSIIKIRFEPNPHFRESLNPGFRYIELIGGGGLEDAVKAVLKNGLADFLWRPVLDIQVMENMTDNGSGRLIFTRGPFVERLYLNLTDPYQYGQSDVNTKSLLPHPFFHDEKVRKAFAHAIDREAIAGLFGKGGRATKNILVAPDIYRSKNTEHLYPFDLKRAVSLLNEAGWKDTDGDGIRDKDGVKMKVVYQTTLNPLRQKIQQIIKRDLERIGIEVKLKMTAPSVFFSSNPLNPKSFRRFFADMQSFTKANYTPDPYHAMAMWSCARENEMSKSKYPPYNCWCNADYEVLLSRATIEPNPKKYKELMILMNDMLIRDVAVIPLVNRITVHAVSNTLDGLEFTPWDMTTWRIKDWRRKKEK